MTAMGAMPILLAWVLGFLALTIGATVLCLFRKKSPRKAETPRKLHAQGDRGSSRVRFSVVDELMGDNVDRRGSARFAKELHPSKLLLHRGQNGAAGSPAGSAFLHPESAFLNPYGPRGEIHFARIQPLDMLDDEEEDADNNEPSVGASVDPPWFPN